MNPRNSSWGLREPDRNNFGVLDANCGITVQYDRLQVPVGVHSDWHNFELHCIKISPGIYADSVERPSESSGTLVEPGARPKKSVRLYALKIEY